MPTAGFGGSCGQRETRRGDSGKSDRYFSHGASFLCEDLPTSARVFGFIKPF
jgi:hypothetical protein